MTLFFAYLFFWESKSLVHINDCSQQFFLGSQSTNISSGLPRVEFKNFGIELFKIKILIGTVENIIHLSIFPAVSLNVKKVTENCYKSENYISDFKFAPNIYCVSSAILTILTTYKYFKIAATRM